jgi:hypothetical protein
MSLIEKYLSLNEASERTQFRVSPRGSKMRYYYDLTELENDFDKEELKNANIEVLFNGVVVGHLNTDKVIDEVFGLQDE